MGRWRPFSVCLSAELPTSPPAGSGLAYVFHGPLFRASQNVVFSPMKRSLEPSQKENNGIEGPQDKLDAVLSKRFAVHPILDCDIDSVTSPLEPAVKRGRFGPALPDLRDEIKALDLNQALACMPSSPMGVEENCTSPLNGSGKCSIPSLDSMLKSEGQHGATAAPAVSVSASASSSDRPGPDTTSSASSSQSSSRSTSPVTVAPKTGRWTKSEDEMLRQAVDDYGAKNWKQISDEAFHGLRSDVQCLHRWQKVLKPGLRKGQWVKDEDDIVRDLVAKMGGAAQVKWSTVAEHLPGRLGKQVRERWQNHLDPSLTKEPWAEAEDQLLISLQALMGNRWSEIARAFVGRSENSVKNRWNSKQRRSLAQERKQRTGSELGIRTSNREGAEGDSQVSIDFKRALQAAQSDMGLPTDAAREAMELERGRGFANDADVKGAGSALLALKLIDQQPPSAASFVSAVPCVSTAPGIGAAARDLQIEVDKHVPLHMVIDALAQATGP